MREYLALNLFLVYMTQIASSNNKCKSSSLVSVPKTVAEVSDSVYKIEGADFECGY